MFLFFFKAVSKCNVFDFIKTHSCNYCYLRCEYLKTMSECKFSLESSKTVEF